MNAAVLHTLGQPPRYEPFAEPSPADGEALVHVHAAALKPLDKARADGSHYTSMGALPAVAGVDGTGRLDDGSRVVFAFPRPPFGAMAERTVVARSRCLPVPDGIDDVTAAAVFNPGLSAWGSLTWRAQLAPGETVLILGATGATGQLEAWMDAYQQLMARVARGELRLDIETVPLAEVETAWQRNARGRRIVFVP
ncbi:MAG TPA: zinc-binding alcohol dehydrogenase family protein [Thermoanaerobaculia bacterium]|jgi:NADPH2:quinone reductase|nr:zinc-binding alcohol dehydrogenase family protein [Thermoanaerobaculia bacterium]